ncbi:MAG: 1-acyl-sn-glycerol-3-phosphate acyltransferase [Tannerella sp.]|nr:1-acyl-sn-glycerol-3-phosphate acyltransferase [Tannerella sp.]
MTKKELLVDVRTVLRRKAPVMAKWIPAFVVNGLCRLVHEEELNRIVERYRHLEGVVFMQALVKEFDVKLDLAGEEHLPPDGRACIFASNHPLGGLDGICLAAFLGERYNSNICYLVNDLLLSIPNLQSIFIPVNKHGTQSRDAVLQMDAAYRSGRQILTFPAGFCSRKQKGQIRDTAWKKSFVQKAVAYRRDIVPVHFAGRNSDFFYRLADIRKRSGLKINVEMLCLPGEMFKNRHQSFRIRIGKPIPWQTFDRTKRWDEWAEWVKEKVYLLSTNN